MDRGTAVLYVAYVVDDAGAGRTAVRETVQRNDRLIGWQCGFEPLFVIVRSYLPDVRIDDDSEAETLAMDYLAERGWFGTTGARPADYIL